jgi:signal transduction histidine kinase
MARYQAVVEAFDGFLYICSPDYRVEFMNQRLIERTGRNAVGELCYRALHNSESVCEWCVNGKVFQGETIRWEVQSPKDHRWYYVVNTPIRHADGTLSKQSMITDITDRKQAEEAMKENEAALRNSKKDLQRLAGKLISAQEEELRRLSRELHDDLTQRLAVLAIEAGKLELDLSKTPGRFPGTVQTVAQIKDQLIKVSEDVHTISRQLHPTILDDLGLVRAIESECAAVMRRYPIGITIRKENVPDAISDDIALCLYRVVQEGLRNIAAHSGAKNCEIFLKGDDHALCLTVSDDGTGFDPLAVRSMPGLGLSSMRERVQLIQGEFAIRSQPGKGAVITVRVPLAGDAA